MCFRYKRFDIVIQLRLTQMHVYVFSRFICALLFSVFLFFSLLSPLFCVYGHDCCHFMSVIM